MLTLNVSMGEGFDEKSQRFVATETYELELEHSLASLSVWESREEKPFLGKAEKTTEEVLRYIADMTLTKDVPTEVFSNLSSENLESINTYINAAMTATTFRDIQQLRPSREILTAEIMYHWMVSLTIPFECQYWHLNRLITLVKVCNEKNKPPNKRTKFDRHAASRRAEMNRQRQAQHATTG